MSELSPESEIHPTSSGRYAPPDDRVYAIHLGDEEPPGEISVSGLRLRDSARARLLETGELLPWPQVDGQVCVRLPTEMRSRLSSCHAWTVVFDGGATQA